MKMKNILFVVILTICCFMIKPAEGQEYISFPDSNAVWKVVYKTYPPGPMPSYEFHFDQYIGGDTIINNILYKKLYELDYDPNCSLNTYGPNYVGCFRNEISEKKVYFIKKTQSDELLLYDFSLNIGDTVPQTHINYSYPHLVVENIDSVIVGSSYRKRFTYLQETYPPVFAIEGIGAHTGLLEPMQIFEQQHLLRCFTLENELLYINADSCNLETDTCISVNIPDQAPYTFEVLIYPNPADTYLQVDVKTRNPQEATYQFILYNTQGFISYSRFFESNSFVGQLDALPPGVYIWVLKRNGFIVKRSKLLVR